MKIKYLIGIIIVIFIVSSQADDLLDELDAEFEQFNKAKVTPDNSDISDNPDDEFGRFSLGPACDYVGLDDTKMPDYVHTFESSDEADQVVQDIVSIIGLEPNFSIRAGGVENAAAVVKGDKRYILYSQSFMDDMRRKTGTKWAAVSIMAHEIGHHLQGHTLEAGGSRPKIELEADKFSGSVLQKLGADSSEALIAMRTLLKGNEGGSRTHPALRDREEAILAGWRASSGSKIIPDEEPEPIRREKPRPNSCEYANDNNCDEPDYCDYGTDTNDCSRWQAPQPPPQPQPQHQQAASACCDRYTGQAVCGMAVAMPRGLACQCSGMYGVGISCY